MKINKAIDQILPGSDQRNKEKQSENKYKIEMESDMQIDWPEILLASPPNRNLEWEIQNDSPISIRDSTKITPLTKLSNKTKNVTSRSQENKIDNATPNNKKKKKKLDVSIFGENISDKNKKKQVNKRSLLISFFETIVHKLNKR